MKQNKQRKKETTNSNKWRSALSIGLSGGVIWGMLSYAFYYLQFTDVGPSMYAKPILNQSYILKWQGHLIGLGFFIMYVLLASFLYAAIFIRFSSPWVGIGYGLAWWGIVFLVLNPLFDLTKSVKELGLNSNSVMLSIFILLGLFIGYSLSIEFNNVDK